MEEVTDTFITELTERYNGYENKLRRMEYMIQAIFEELAELNAQLQGLSPEQEEFDVSVELYGDKLVRRFVDMGLIRLLEEEEVVDEDYQEEHEEEIGGAAV